MDAEALKDLFEPFGPISVRRMFSGHGLYADGLFFGLAIAGEIYLKADTETEPAFAAAGSMQFTYQRHTRLVKLSFWRLPADAYDDSDELKRWSGFAVAAVRRAGAAKARKTKVDKAKASPIRRQKTRAKS